MSVDETLRRPPASEGRDRRALAALDAADPLAPLRDRFRLPAGLVYLDGNSLGPLAESVAERVARVVADEWGRDLVRSWNEHGWIDLPATVGAKIAPLVGAAADEVTVADSTSVDLFKVLVAALELVAPDGGRRRVVLSDRDNFPTDLYVMQGVERLWPERARLRLVGRDEVPAAIEAAGDELAVVALTHVDYRTGELYDLDAITAAAHRAGALVVWDLAHSAGAVPVDLERAGADFAIGCGYKYLNGGPGAPAFLYVARRHQESARTPLQGWLGHAEAFRFEVPYRPAPGVARFRCGTPPVLSLAALDAALDLFAEVDLAELRAKSVGLTSAFVERVESACAGHGLELASPRDPERRGSQVSLRHPEGYAIVQALAARGVVGDFRAPDVLRFGFAPLYLRYVDAWDAAEELAAVLESGEWDRPEHRRRAKVT